MKKKFSWALVFVLVLSFTVILDVFAEEEYDYFEHYGMDSKESFSYELKGDKLFIKDLYEPEKTIFIIDGVIEEVGEVKRKEFDLTDSLTNNVVSNIKQNRIITRGEMALMTLNALKLK